MIAETLFRNRVHAGSLLCEKLSDEHIKVDLVIALPRGGVPLGAKIADCLRIPLRLLLIRKIGHPINPEYAIGAVSETGLFLNEGNHYGQEYLKNAIKKERSRILEMKTIFKNLYQGEEVRGKDVLLVDDGIATGTCMRLAIKELQESGAHKIRIAVPVCAQHSANKIEQEVDSFICLYSPVAFLGIGAYYREFDQLTDEKVVEILNKK
jgi:putative phosphoribosyl transferase